MFDPRTLPDFMFLDTEEKTPREETDYLEQRGIIPHHQRYRNLKLIRYLLNGNRGPGVTQVRRVEILKVAQAQWIGGRVKYLNRVGEVEFLMPLNRAYGPRRSAHPDQRTFEAWVRWEDTGHRHNMGLPLLKLELLSQRFQSLTGRP